MANRTAEPDESITGTALATINAPADGVMALAHMPDADFKSRLDAMKRGITRQRTIQKELMIGPTEENPEGEDYGVIPGTKKPTLLKPGAEKLCNFYGLVPTFSQQVVVGDGVHSPVLRVLCECRLHRTNDDGPVVGMGLGAANSWERKHRYRSADRACPACGVAGTIRRSGYERNGDKGWYCHTRAGGCNATFHSKDPAIVDQQGGRVENPDPYDVENTLVKMAKKRALVDATLTATATSGLFAQDIEDLEPTNRPTTTDAAEEPDTGRQPGDEPPDHEEPPTEITIEQMLEAFHSINASWQDAKFRVYVNGRVGRELPADAPVGSLTQAERKILLGCIAFTLDERAKKKAAKGAAK
jgi:hypothetical protein